MLQISKKSPPVVKTGGFFFACGLAQVLWTIGIEKYSANDRLAIIVSAAV